MGDYRKMKNKDQLIRDTWHLQNILHNYVLEYEEVMLEKGVDSHYFKQLEGMLKEMEE